MTILALLWALLGHAVLGVFAVNRLHSIGWRRGAIHAVSLTIAAFMAVVPLALVAWLWVARIDPLGSPAALLVCWPQAAYLVLCWLAAAWGASGWFWRHVLASPPSVLRHHRSRVLAPLSTTHSADDPDHEHHFMAHLPGNETLWLDVAERGLNMPRMVAALEGLTIVHLSDLHFTGRVGKGYFLEVVRLANQFQPDLVAITGDIADKVECLSWIPDTLGKLTSRYGAYFILGNHDLRVGAERLRHTLGDAGLIDLGGCWREIHARGVPIILAGNELPWFRPAADLSTAPPRMPAGPLRIVLSHSPDQLDWARAHEVDLVLAGHVHGGQIRIPWIGPIMSPSRQGVKYAAGTFHAPPTILHVTRGISGEVPLRMNCPPEIVCLTLHAAEDGSR